MFSSDAAQATDHVAAPHWPRYRHHIPTTYLTYRVTDHIPTNTNHIPATLPTTYRLRYRRKTDQNQPHTDSTPTTRSTSFPGRSGRCRPRYRSLCRPHTDRYQPLTDHLTNRVTGTTLPITLPATLPTTYRPILTAYRPVTDYVTDHMPTSSASTTKCVEEITRPTKQTVQQTNQWRNEQTEKEKHRLGVLTCDPVSWSDRALWGHKPFSRLERPLRLGTRTCPKTDRHRALKKLWS